MHIVAAILSWIVGLTALLFALSTLAFAPYAAIPLVLIALVVLPPVRTWAAKSFPKGLTFAQRTLVCVALFISFMVVLVTTVKAPESKAPPTVSAGQGQPAGVPPGPSASLVSGSQPPAAPPVAPAASTPSAATSPAVERPVTPTPAPVTLKPNPPPPPAAAGVVFKLEIFLVPPKGVYGKPTGLTASALKDERRREEVDQAIDSLVRLVAPGRDVLISAAKPPEVTSKTPYFDVELRVMAESRPPSVACTVGFYPPAPKRAVFDSLTTAALSLGRVIHPGKDVFTLACLGDDSLSERYFSGNLYYEAATEQVVPSSSRSGGSRVQVSLDRYIRVIEKHPYATKDRKGQFFYSIEVVYPKEPAPDAALKDLIAEIVALARTTEGDINAYAYVGTESKDPPWEQLVDKSDTFKRFVAAEYSAKTTTITSRDSKVKLEGLKP